MKTPALERPTQLALVSNGSEPKAPTPAPAPSAASSPTPKTPAPAPKPPAKPVVAYFEAPEEVDEVMSTILSWPRSHASPAEQAFRSWLRDYLVDTLGQQLKEHAEGAFSVTIPREDGKPSAVLFSCHIDTVDADSDSKIGMTKKLLYDKNFGQIFLETPVDPKSMDRFGCLGADDGAGIWIMLTMIHHKKPGTYLFHRGEECGGVSAKAIARTEKEWLKTFDYAVAFDRPRDNEVITHQGGIRCASDKAAQALCKALNAHEMYYEPSDRGVYTDTKEYRGVISECFNLGVGYQHQHTEHEVLDYAFCNALAKAAIAVDWDSLPVDRTPVVEDSYDWMDSWTSRCGDRTYKGYWADDREEMEPVGSSHTKSKPAKTPAPAPKQQVIPTSPTRWIENCGLAELLVECETNPADVAEGVIALVRKIRRLEADVEYLDGLVSDALYNGTEANDSQF